MNCDFALLWFCTFPDYPAKPVITKVDTYLTKAVVFWKIPSNGGTEITSLTVQYKNSTQKTWKSIEIRPVTGVKHTISGLKPDTLYYFRIHAKNKVGTSPYSIAFPSRTKVGMYDNTLRNRY